MKMIFRDIMGKVLYETWSKHVDHIVPREDDRVRVAEQNWKVLYVVFDYDNNRIYIELRSDA